MQNLLLQPSAIPTAMALLILASLVQIVRAKSHPGPGPRPLQPVQKVLALAFGVVAVVASVLATLIDADWIGSDPYRFAVIPATCTVLGCSLGAFATLRSGRTPSSPATTSIAVLLGLAYLVAFGLIACSGMVLAGLA
jgi:hypothetical protein